MCIFVYKSIDIYAYSSFKFTIETDSFLGLMVSQHKKIRNFRS